jgi:hypothetical protein
MKMKGVMKGGNTVYGRGYGANCYDPSFSIYNTNTLKLFPYNKFAQHPNLNNAR